jgi:hypothetical protein
MRLVRSFLGSCMSEGGGGAPIADPVASTTVSSLQWWLGATGRALSVCYSIFVHKMPAPLPRHMVRNVRSVLESEYSTIYHLVSEVLGLKKGTV